MKRLTATVLLSVAVLLGYVGIFPASSDDDIGYIPLNGEQIKRLFSGLEEVNIPDANGSTPWQVKFYKDGSWESTSHSSGYSSTGYWKIKNKSLCLSLDTLDVYHLDEGLYSPLETCSNLFVNINENNLVGDIPQLKIKHFIFKNELSKNLIEKLEWKSKKQIAEKQQKTEPKLKGLEQKHWLNLARQKYEAERKKAEIALQELDNKRKKAELALKEAENKRQANLARKKAEIALQELDNKRKKAELALKEAENKRKANLAHKRAEAERRKAEVALQELKEERKKAELALKEAEERRKVDLAHKEAEIALKVLEKNRKKAELALKEIDETRLEIGFDRQKFRPAVASTIEFGSYHALVIGNNDYKHLPKLENAVQDASDVSGVLEKLYGFEVQTIENGTRSDIIGALVKLRAKLTWESNLLIYYAGHGTVDDYTSVGYWQPVEAEEDDLTNWISNTTITHMLKSIRAKHVMVIADSCYSGTLVRSAHGGLRTAKERDVWIQRSLQKRSRTALVSGGLEPVMDGGGENNSIFAKALLTVLRDNKSVIDGAMLFDGLKRQVALGSEQTPQYSDIRNAEHDGGEFFLVRRAGLKKQQSAPKTAHPLKALGNLCSGLGFIEGTEKHGDCVMKLFK